MFHTSEFNGSGTAANELDTSFKTMTKTGCTWVITRPAWETHLILAVGKQYRQWGYHEGKSNETIVFPLRFPKQLVYYNCMHVDSPYTYTSVISYTLSDLKLSKCDYYGNHYVILKTLWMTLGY